MTIDVNTTVEKNFGVLGTTNLTGNLNVVSGTTLQDLTVS